jgi:cytochrome b6-f complex iron-sulfur subunit
MGNWQVEPAARPAAITKEAVRALRNEAPGGITRRRLLRVSLGLGIGVWLLENASATLGFLWPNLAGGFGGKVKIGSFQDVKTQNSSLPISDGFPAYYADARSYVVLIDTARQQFVPGSDPTGDGHPVNVRALYQRCPHLGCKPNPCLRNFWLECPCHGSRYDRLGIKAAGAQYGPAPRSMDRFGVDVDGEGVLTIDTGKKTLGPLPVALGQPGLIPPRSPIGCI